MISYTSYTFILLRPCVFVNETDIIPRSRHFVFFSCWKLRIHNTRLRGLHRLSKTLRRGRTKIQWEGCVTGQNVTVWYTGGPKSAGWHPLLRNGSFVLLTRVHIQVGGRITEERIAETRGEGHSRTLGETLVTKRTRLPGNPPEPTSIYLRPKRNSKVYFTYALLPLYLPATSRDALGVLSAYGKRDNPRDVARHASLTSGFISKMESYLSFRQYKNELTSPQYEIS